MRGTTNNSRFIRVLLIILLVILLLVRIFNHRHPHVGFGLPRFQAVLLIHEWVQIEEQREVLKFYTIS